MSRDWSSLRRRAEASAAARARRAGAALRWRQRPDGILGALLVLLLLLMIGGGAGAAWVVAIRPLFDPPVVQPLRDDRVLANIHDPDLPPFTDGLSSPWRGDSIFARTDGTAHILDAETLLLSDIDPLPEEALSADLAQLTTICHRPGDCPGGDEVLALTTSGGAAQLDGRAWQVLISDQPWRGRDGEPVAQDQLVSWSADLSGDWLLAATGDNGVALFDQRGNAWVDPGLSPEAEALFPAAVIREVARGGDGFALATDIGLFSALPFGPGWRIAPEDDLEGDILDLAPTPAGDLLAIQEAPCPGGEGGSCLSVWQGRPGEGFAQLIGEEEHHPDLGMTSLLHLAWQDGVLVALGSEGIHLYDPDTRGWRQARIPAGAQGVTGAADTAIDAWHADAGGDRVLFAAGSTAGEIRGGRITTAWDLEDHRLVQILPVSAGLGTQVYGLTETGQVLDVAEGELLTHDDPALDPDREILRAAAMGEVLALISRDGVVLLDVATRRRAWIDASDLPVTLSRPAIGLAGDPAGLWHWNAATGEVGFLEPQGDWPDVTLTGAAPMPMGERLASVLPEGDELSITLQSGHPVQVRRSPDLRFSTPLGPPFQGRGGFSSMAALGQDLAFSDGQGVQVYSLTRRGWTERMPPIPNERIVDIAAGAELFALTGSGRVYRYDGQSWGAVFGLGQPAPMAASAITDAMATGGSVLLAGDGAVMQLDPGSLAVTRSWSGGRGEVQLLGVSGGQPVWLSDGILRRGTQALTPQGGETLSAVLAQGHVIQHLRLGGNEQLRRTPFGPSPEACLFNGAAAPGGDVLGGRVLPGGQVYVQTSAGTHLHVPQDRRWLRVQGLPAGALRDRQAFLVDGWLFDLSDGMLRGVPLAAVEFPESCDSPTVSIGWTLARRVTDIAVDEAGGRLALLRPDGQVELFSGGQVTTVLPPATEGPDPSGLREAMRLSDGLALTTADRIWTYHARDRHWGNRAVTPQDGAEMFVERTEAGFLVTQWGDRGRSFGAVAEGPPTGTIATRPLSPVTLPPFDIAPDSLRDLAQLAGRWIRLTDGELAISNLAATDWDSRIALTPATDARQITRIGGMTVIATRTAAGESLAYIPGPLTGQGQTALDEIAALYRPGEDRDHALVAGERLLWRIDAEGRLLRCAVWAGGDLNSDCEETSPAPLPLDPDQVGRAYRIGTVHLVEIDGRFRWLSPDMRQLSDAGLTLSEEALVFRLRGQRHAFDPETGRLWHLSPGQAEEVQDGVARVVTAGGRTWLELAEGGYLRLAAGGPERPEGPDRALTLTAEGVLHALDEAGQPVTDATPAPPLLAPLPQDTSTLLPGRHRLDPEAEPVEGWWVQTRDGRVNFHYDGQCEVAPPDPVEETAPAGDATEGDAAEGEETAPAAPPAALSPAPVWESAPDAIAPGEEAPQDASEGPVGDDQPPEQAAPEATEAPEEDETAQAEAPPPPEPVHEPCPATLFPEGGPQLGGRLAAIASLRVGVVQLRSDTEALDLPFDGTPPERSATDAPVLSAPAALEDHRGEIVARIETVGGTATLAPNAIIRDGDRLTVSDGIATLDYQLSPESDLPALNEGWLSWDRAARELVFAGVEGAVALAPEDALVNGRLLPDQPGRAAVLADGFAWLTRSGLWHYSDGEAGPTLVAAAPFPEPLGLSQGVFLLPQDGLDAETGASVDDTGSYTLTVADLTVTGQLRPLSVGAEITRQTSGGPAAADAFAATGFAFDRRLGVAFDGPDLLLLTDLGLMATERLGGLDLGPGNTPPQGPLMAGAARPQLQQSGQWWQRDGGGSWQQIDDPLATRPIGESGGRVWALEDGTLTITATDPQQGWRVARQGLSFDSDALRGIARDGDTLLLLTEAATESFANLAFPGAPSGTALDPLPADRRAEALADETGDWTAFAEGDPVLTWQPAQGGWYAVPAAASTPWLSRTPVAMAEIEVTLGTGAPELTLTARTGAGTDRWTGLTWQQGRRLPQNRATALHVAGSDVLIGTEAGLRLLAANGATNRGLHDLSDRPAAGEPAAPVTELGHPEDAPDRLTALGLSGLCRDLDIGSGGISATACAAPTDLARRYVTDNALWAWWEGDGGLSAGYFVDGQIAPDLPVRLTGGYWPHDRLRAWSRTCGGGRVEIWRDAEVMVAGQPAQGGAQTLPADFADLHCQADDRPLGQGLTLPTGLYLNARTGSPLRLSSGTWQQVPADIADGLEQQADGRVPYAAERYRVTIAGGTIGEDYLTLDGDWHSLLAGPDGLALDGVVALGTVSGDLLLATGAGLHNPRTWPDGLGIDPDRLHLWTPGEDVPALSDCAPDIVAASDGDTHGLAATADPAFLMRCADGAAVLSLVPDPQTDLGAIGLHGEDPFVTADLVTEPDVWTWRRDGWPAGGSPVIALEFQGEPMPFSGGRLGIDAYTALAAAFDGRIDMLSPTGWWMSDAGGDLSLVAQARSPGPVDPATVTALADDRDGEAPALCLETPDGPVLAAADGTARQVQSCGQFQGRDGFWTYRDLPDALRATGIARNGPQVERVLVDGRFSDLWVGGQATGSADGSELILPTPDGALALNRRTGRVEGYYALPGILGLLRDDTGAPMAITETGLRLLTGEGRPDTATCPALEDLGDTLSATILRLDQTPLNRLNLRMALGQATILLEIDCASAEEVRVGSVTLDVSEALRFRGNAGRWLAESGLLSLTAPGLDGMILGNDAGRTAELPVEDEAGGQPILSMTASPQGHGIYLVTPGTILSLDRDAALEWLYSGAGGMAAPEIPAAAPAAQGTGPEAPGAPDPEAPAAPEPETEAPEPSVIPEPRPEPPQPPAQEVEEPQPPAPQAERPAPMTTNMAMLAQMALQRLGHYNGAIDGVPGPLTEAAIRRYQQSIGVAVTGELTIPQFDRLIEDGSLTRK